MDASEKPYHHGNLRTALIEEAVKLAERVGSQGISLRAVARAAGVSPNAPYRHFPNKRALLAEVAAIGMAEIAVALNEVSAGAESLPTATETYTSFLVRRPGYAAILFSDELAGVESPALNQARADLFGAWLRHVEPSIAATVASPMAASEKIVAVARAWSAAQGIYTLRRSDSLHFLPDTVRPSPRQIGSFATRLQA